MTAKIIDGKAVAAEMRAECRARTDKLMERFGVTPGLAVILVGENPASLVYVRNKVRACADVGIRSVKLQFPADVAQDTITAKIEELNRDPAIHGILVQLPLPARFDLNKVLGTIALDKDVDGFHLYNVGGLVLGNAIFPPCTPYGVIKLIDHESIPI